MKLVIVESPTKTKSLSKYLGGDFEIMASMGHVRDLPKSKIGIEIKELKNPASPAGRSKNQKIKTEQYEFFPVYELMDRKEDTVRRLKVEAAKAEEIILASDPDREGEAIAWHVKEILSGTGGMNPAPTGNGKTKKRKKELIFKRVAYNSITKEAILEAMEHPREIDMNLVNSQQARRFLDRLVGYKLSPILWKKVRRGLSAGRVQSVAVRLIVDREREIEKFVPVEYWQIKVLVANHELRIKNFEFWVELAKFKNKKAEIHKAEEAKEILESLNTGDYVVSDINKSERKTQPHAPFKTSTLQQAAANVLGWSAKKTMSIAQKLYEQGDITYHRTDSFNLAPVAIEAVRKFIGEKYGQDYLPKAPRIYKTAGKVVAQEAHEAVRPTHIEVIPEKYTGQEMVMDEKKLYSLIWRRSVACQMAEAVFDDTRVVVTAGECELTANGIVVKFDGWKKLFVKDPTSSRLRGAGDEPVALPEMTVGEKLTKKEVESLQKFTQPQPRFNDASLIKELEKKGIGRPSTYAAIISTILDRRYVEQKEKKFFPTSIGKAVVDFLMENFPKEMDYEFTAKMEDQLDDIAAGKLTWTEMLSNFWGDFSKKLIQVDKDSVRVGVPTMGTGVTCPLCKEGEVVIRDGKFGKFLSCNRYPECVYKAPYIEYLEGVTCEKCGKRVVLKKTRTNRDFFGCEDYPNCTWASWKKPVGKDEV